jgi:pyruvate dehydrogenase E2 component (dihydrolipoamide acetyltransferase)
MEFEAFYSGNLLHVGLKEGDSAKVDSLLAIIGPKGKDISTYLNVPTKKVEVTKENVVTESKPEIKKADQAIQNTSEIIKSNDRIFISPLAKKLANERDIDINQLKGSGENGRIIKSDIENFKAPVQSSITEMPSSTQSVIEDYYEVNHSQMRKVIAKRLSESKFSAPHYYLNIELDMSETIAFRKQCNSIPDTKISFNDIIVKACAVALKNNPSVNSQWFDDKIRYNNFVNIGVAVGVEDGLIVPVLKNADKMSVADISRSVKEMAGMARDKKLTPEMMQGSTFTISNLGMFGIESFTSIINSPNSVILSVGSIVEKPVVKDGSIVVGNTMKLTLACDHRVVDGLTGAKFLQSLKPLIENPLSMLI